MSEVPGYAHDIRLRDAAGRVFGAPGDIRLLAIPKFAAAVATEQERWVNFFKEGGELDTEHLPPWLDTPEMRQAVSTLHSFPEKERAYHAYQARLEYQRMQRAMQQDMEERTRAMEEVRAELARVCAAEEQARAAEARERAEKEQARTAEAREREAKDHALAELERLRQELERRQGS